MTTEAGPTHIQVLVEALEVEFCVGGAYAHGVAGAWLNEVGVGNTHLVQLLEKISVKPVRVGVLRLLQPENYTITRFSCRRLPFVGLARSKTQSSVGTILSFSTAPRQPGPISNTL